MEGGVAAWPERRKTRSEMKMAQAGPPPLALGLVADAPLSGGHSGGSGVTAAAAGAPGQSIRRRHTNAQNQQIITPHRQVPLCEHYPARQQVRSCSSRTAGLLAISTAHFLYHSYSASSGGTAGRPRDLPQTVSRSVAAHHRPTPFRARRSAWAAARVPAAGFWDFPKPCGGCRTSPGSPSRLKGRGTIWQYGVPPTQRVGLPRACVLLEPSVTGSAAQQTRGFLAQKWSHHRVSYFRTQSLVDRGRPLPRPPPRVRACQRTDSNQSERAPCLSGFCRLVDLTPLLH